MNDIFKLLILSVIIDDCGSFLPFCERRCFPINPPCRPTCPPTCEPFYPCPPCPPCENKPCPPPDKWDLPHYMKSERDC